MGLSALAIENDRFGDAPDEPLALQAMDWDDEPWCVDLGAGMEVMTSQAIRRALARGTLWPSLKVWRDGHPCWQPISDFPELMPSDLGHARTDRFEVPEQSGPRRIERRAAISAPVPKRGGLRKLWRDKTAAFTSAFFGGILLGLLVLFPLGWVLGP